MGFYRTCRNCLLERESCERRSEVARGIKGLSLTAVSFRCRQREPLFRFGQRVSVTWKVLADDSDSWSYEDRWTEETWPATVVNESKKGFLIAVDDVDSDFDTPARSYIKSENLFCSVSACKLAALDEPDRRVCEYCHNPEDGRGGVLGTCWGANGVVSNCLASADTRPKDEDPLGASLASGAVPEGQTPKVSRP